MGEQETATAGTVGRDAASSWLDYSDDNRESRVGSLIGEVSSDMHGSGSAGVVFFHDVINIFPEYSAFILTKG